MNPSIEPIPFARPSLGAEEERAVIAVLRSGWLTTAGEAKAFEEEFAAAVGAPHALAVNSATAGLHLALESLGIGPGDRVLTTPYTFTATAETARYLGAEPVFADIDPRSLNLDPLEAEKALKKDPAIKAIVPVHVGGLACDMEALCELARRYGAAVVEDAAHAFPARIGERHLGLWGDVGVFSFYATKTITTGEGGMIVTENEELARRMSIMRLHGIDREVWDRYRTVGSSWRYAVVEAGYKYNLPDLAAAIGRAQLKKAESFRERRREIAGRYLEAFADCDFLHLPADDPEHAWHLFIIRLDGQKLALERDGFAAGLQEAGIGTSVHYLPLHMMPYYRQRYGLSPEDFPRARNAYLQALSLPIYPGLSDEQVERVVEAVRSLGLRHLKERIHGR
jgi:dTDP-4-amino-4,6-dideoxygalactose transaminase